MKTLEEILIDIGDTPLEKHGGHDRILKVLKITFKNVEVIQMLNETITGYEAFDIISDIEDVDIKNAILNKRFSVRKTDVHSNAKWLMFLSITFLVVILLTLMFNSLYFKNPLDGDDKGVLISLVDFFINIAKILFLVDVT